MAKVSGDQVASTSRPALVRAPSSSDLSVVSSSLSRTGSTRKREGSPDFDLPELLSRHNTIAEEKQDAITIEHCTDQALDAPQPDHIGKRALDAICGCFIAMWMGILSLFRHKSAQPAADPIVHHESTQSGVPVEILQRRGSSPDIFADGLEDQPPSISVENRSTAGKLSPAVETSSDVSDAAISAPAVNTPECPDEDETGATHVEDLAEAISIPLPDTPSTETGVEMPSKSEQNLGVSIKALNASGTSIDSGIGASNDEEDVRIPIIASSVLDLVEAQTEPRSTMLEASDASLSIPETEGVATAAEVQPRPVFKYALPKYDSSIRWADIDDDE